MRDEQLNQLEQKMKTLEAEVIFLKKQNQEILDQLSALRQRTKTPTEVTVNKQKRRPASAHSKKEKKPVDWEVLIGQVWLPRIFVFVLLLGIVWAFKVASTIGLFGPGIRSLLGFIAGGALIVLAEKQIKQNRRALGLVLYGGSVSIFMLTTFAVHVLYHFIPASIAFILNIIWIALGIFLSNKHRSQVLAIFVGIGGYLIPFLLESQHHNLYLFASYEVLLYFSLLLFSLQKRFVWLYIASAGLLHAAFFAYIVIGSFSAHSNALALKIFAVAILIQHLLLFVAFLKKTLYIREQMSTLFASFVLSIMWVFAAFDHNDGIINLSLTLFLAIYAYIAYLFHQKDSDRQSIALSIATFSLLTLFIHLFDSEYIASFVLLEGAIALFLGIKLKSVLQQISGGFVCIIGSVSVLSDWIHEIVSIETLHWTVELATLGFLMNVFKRFPLKNDLQKIPFASFIAVLFLFVSQISVVLTQSFSSHIQQMALSFTWAVFAVLSVVFGTMRAKRSMRLLGVVLLFLTLLKLIFIDLPIVSLLIRSILFIGLGGIGILMSRMFYRKS
ncbi:DUF2339 domain-containing protein [Anoxybacteroides tepidamans]|uniref:DUF2339 domain-containing protein n=1 Tax=Anoxybacteroides tepidamans TaxID=265948 RepID=UPI0004873079|nr:DUF2339 domain-containing protein [Anoxybacillus tepidamans]